MTRPSHAPLNKVKHERIRKIVDPYLQEQKLILLECCKGDFDENGVLKRDGSSGWMYGKSAPFRGYDVFTSTLPQKLQTLLGVEPGQKMLTPKQAECMMNLFQGAMESAAQVTRIKQNRKLPNPYPEENINPVLDVSRNRIFKNAFHNFEDAFYAEIRKRNEAGTKTTAAQALALFKELANSVTFATSEDAAFEVKTAGELAKDQTRKFFQQTGIRARELLGTIPGG